MLVISRALEDGEPTFGWIKLLLFSFFQMSLILHVLSFNS